MNFKQLVVLFPCHSLEDFPVHHEGASAEGLLAAWSALWHPALIAGAEAIPQWRRAEEPPEGEPGSLVLVPDASRDWVPCGWADEARQTGAVVLEGLARREEIFQAVFAEHETEAAAVDSQLVADFLALGFAFLQIELLTRQTRYSSYIDELYLADRAVQGAKAAVAGDAEAARAALGNCYDTIGQARDHFYPIDSHLIDLILVAPTTMGAALRSELASDVPTNLLLSGQLVEMMARDEPATLEMIRSRLEQGTLGLVGGEYCEREIPLMPREIVLQEFARGRTVYEKHLGRTPQVFGRRRFGLSPILPQILLKNGFQGAIHATFDGGSYPEASQAKARWEGDDGSAIDILSRVPLDASRPATYLSLSHRLGDTLDTDQVGTLLFARWPGAASPWHDDLRRVASFGPTLGRFMTVDEYFTNTYSPDSTAHFLADQYRSGYLSQSVAQGEANPLSRYQTLHREHFHAAAAQTIDTLGTLLRDSPPSSDAGPHEVQAAVKQLAEQLAPEASATSGYLLVNPTASKRRVNVELPELKKLPAVGDHLRVVGERNGTVQAVVDLPGIGFGWVGPSDRGAISPAAKLPLAEENLLRNEHFEVVINPTTGALQGIRSYQRRGNLLAQQLAFRSAQTHWKPADEAHEADSVMAADSVEITAVTTAMGEITSRGRLLDREGKLLARFEQKYQLWRGSRVLLLDITLQPEVEPGASPWTSYYASRFAWSDSAAEVWRSLGEGSQRTETRRIEAPHFVEIQEVNHRFTILSGGLPFHKRTGDRIIETLLRVQGETAERFRLGIGIDVAHPMQAALDLLLPDPLAVQAAQPAAGPVGWFFHCNAPNLVATHWEPLVSGGETAGFRVRLLETEGRAGRAALSVWRDVERALLTDYQGQRLAELPLESGKIMIDVARYEWVQIEAHWKR